MKETLKRKPFALLVFLIMIARVESTYIETQLGKNAYFSTNSPAENITFNFDTQDSSLFEYTIWGWYKFNGDKDGIANFLILRGL